MYMSDGEPRRLADGSLDFDFYRRRAARERAQLWRNLVRSRAVPLARLLVAVGVIATAVYVMPAADGTGWKSAQQNGILAAAPHDANLPAKF